MSILDLHADDLSQAALNTPQTAPQPKAPRFSAWSAIPRGVATAAGEVGASLSDVAASFRHMRDATPEQRKQIDRGGVPIEAYSSDLGNTVRDYWRDIRPDPATASMAEQVLFGFSRGMVKIIPAAIVAGPAGVLAAATEEGFTQSDELRRQGVDVDVRSKAGLVQGAGMALAALPLLGQTLPATAALYAAGGPGGFMAQQALTRKILQDAGHEAIGAQFDPFDPVGLAVASILPAGFAAYGIRGQRIAAKAAADEAFRTGPMPNEPTAVGAAARETVSPEVVDAARVMFAVEQRQASSLGRVDDQRAQQAHETALSRAEEQIGRGEPVSVADVAPAVRVPAIETPEFKAWFGESKVVTPEGAPLRVFHGTDQSFDEFRGNAYFTPIPDDASKYSQIQTPGAVENSPNVVPAYISMRNPKEIQTYATRADIDDARESGKFDGVIVRGVGGSKLDHYITFRPEQVKSAIGNSGKFDPNSASLTDSPFATWAEQINAAAKQMAKEADAQRPKGQNRSDGQPTDRDGVAATQPGKPAPPSADLGSGDGSVPGAALGSRGESAAATPGATAEAQAVTARLDAIRAQYPDLQVQMDGMDAPMRLDEFLAAAKAEADEMAADAPLYEIAAACALQNGF